MTYPLSNVLRAATAALALCTTGAWAQTAGTCTGAPVQINFAGAYPVGDYSSQNSFAFPASSASNSSSTVGFSLDVTRAAANPANILKFENSSVALPDGSSSPSPWFVVARTNIQTPGDVATVRYSFSQPVGNMGFAVGSMDSGGALEQVTITAHYADGTSGPITTAVPYPSAPLPPSAWPTQPTVYYAAPGSSAANGVFAGNGSVYVAIPASRPVTSVDVAYAIVATTTGGIGMTPPTFMQCNPPAPPAVPTLNAAWLLALALGLAGASALALRRRRA